MSESSPDEPGPRRLEVGERFAWNEIAPLVSLFPHPVHAQAIPLFAELPALELGPSFRDFTPSEPYREASLVAQEKSKLLPSGKLDAYSAGRPFSEAAIDCANDPDAGLELAWNALLAWEGDGAGGHFRVTHEDQGEAIGEPVEGTWKKVWLSHRAEPDLVATNQAMLFPNEVRRFAYVIHLGDMSHLVNGFSNFWHVLHFRYDDRRLDERRQHNNAAIGSWKTPASDTWVYRPSRRSDLRTNSRYLSTVFEEIDVAPEDFPDFPPHLGAHRFRCGDRRVLLAPFSLAPQRRFEDPDRGPMPAAPPPPRFEARRTVMLEASPTGKGAPYATRTFHLDTETMRPLYQIDRDADGRTTRVSAHTYLWSGDDPERALGWPGIPEPRTLLPFRSVAVHVETGARKRTDFAEVRPTPLPSKAKIRRLTSVTRGFCVAEGTPISTPSGERAVEQLEPGDLVLAYDVVRRTVVSAPLAAVSSSIALSTLLFDGGLRVTADHPLYASGHWTEAEQVDPDARLMRRDGTEARAGAATTLATPIRVYDLTVDGPANFFAADRLVHNKAR